LASFARAWSTAGSQLERLTRHVWLEFDAAGDGGGSEPVPGIVFLHPIDGSASGGQRWARAHVQLTAQMADLVQGRPMRGEVRARLEDCLIALPAHARVFCIGVMAGRPSADARVCLKGLCPGDHVKYLGRVGFAGSSRATALLEELASYVDAINLDLDVGAAVGPRAHLELRCDEEVSPGASTRWARLMAFLVARDLVLPAKATAMLGWPGLPVERLGPARTSLFLRKLSHVKLTWTSDGVAEAKGYFGAWECVRDERGGRLSVATGIGM
jgi:hypothetical protein